MAEKSFNQVFKGYYLERDLASIPSDSGVYGIYRCIHNKSKNTVSLKALLYIGKGDNLIDRLSKHEDWEEWRDELKENELICISYTLVEKQYNERVEAALINSNQPLLNVVYTNSFPFDKTSVSCSGSHEFIKSENIVDRH